MFQHTSKTVLAALLFTAASADISRGAIKTNCGASIQSSVVTKTPSEPQFVSTSTAFVRLPGTALNVVVPAGTKRCVKVRFTPRASCQGNGGNATCTVRAIANNVEMKPGILGIRDSYQWVSELDPGTHLVQIQVRRIAEDAGAIIRVDEWVMDVEILK
jgi:hypothetical protein